MSCSCSYVCTSEALPTPVSFRPLPGQSETATSAASRLRCSAAAMRVTAYRAKRRRWICRVKANMNKPMELSPAIL